jgi:hypothetical protein
VVAIGVPHAHPVVHVLAPRQLAGADRLELLDVVARIEPFAEHNVIHYLAGGGGLPMAAGRQGLEVDGVGEERMQRGGVLGC